MQHNAKSLGSKKGGTVDMIRLGSGLFLLAVFLFGLAVQKDGYTAYFLPRGAMFLLMPGVVLVYWGLRARRSGD